MANHIEEAGRVNRSENEVTRQSDKWVVGLECCPLVVFGGVDVLNEGFLDFVVLYGVCFII